MRETGRRLAESYLKDPPLLAFKAKCELTSGGQVHAKTRDREQPGVRHVG
jgi:hypothetical protein